MTASLTERYRSARQDPELAVLEGFHALKHALRFGAEILDVRTSDALGVRSLAEELAPDVLESIMARATTVSPAAFDALAPSPHPTRVMALARRPEADLASVLDDPAAAPLILLERPTHHGNIGAVVRVAAGAGAAGVLVTGPHDPWHAASLRGGAGLQFALPVLSLGADGVDAVIASDRPVVALDPEGELLVGGSDGGVPARSVLVFGSEREGVTAALLERADRRVAIPMRSGVSSLNLATAVAVTLYLAGGWTAFSG